jgi:hypothetical protein
MNLVKTTAIVFLVAMGAALMAAGANAQSPSTAQTPRASPTTAIPEKIPANWSANGWDQAGWTALRQQCLNMLVESNRRAQMSPAQRRGLKPIPGDWEGCKHLASSFSAELKASSPSTTNLAITPTPINTPLPPTLPVEPQSSNSTTFGPLISGNSFPGGGAPACPYPDPAPNVQGDSQPLDVAADVSPSQNVEMLNRGLFVYDKSGHLQGNAESLYQFWCGTVGANGQTLPACSGGGLSCIYFWAEGFQAGLGGVA